MIWDKQNDFYDKVLAKILQSIFDFLNKIEPIDIID